MNQQALKTEKAHELATAISDFPDQLTGSLRLLNEVGIPVSYIKANHIIVLGDKVGRTAGQLAASVASEASNLPVLVATAGKLPAFANHTSLVIGLAYEGSDPVVCESFSLAFQRNCKLLAVSKQGDLGGLARKFQIPHLKIQYGAPAEFSLGYLLMPVLEMMSRLGEFKFGKELLPTIERLREYANSLRVGIEKPTNRAKELAEVTRGQVARVITAPELVPAMDRWRQLLVESQGWPLVVDEFSTLFDNESEGTTTSRDIKTTLPTIYLRQSEQEDSNLRQLLRSQTQAAGVVYREVIIDGQNYLERLLKTIQLIDYTWYYSNFSNKS